MLILKLLDYFLSIDSPIDVDCSELDNGIVSNLKQLRNVRM